jgi:hypothetical protein
MQDVATTTHDRRYDLPAGGDADDDLETRITFRKVCARLRERAVLMNNNNTHDFSPVAKLEHSNEKRRSLTHKAQSEHGTMPSGGPL